ncbi:MAG: hypothetical protein WAU59_00365 [Rhodoplanes sp.]
MIVRINWAGGFLAAAAMVLSHAASADVKRHSALPEACWGSWAPIEEDCDKAAKSLITLSATRKDFRRNSDNRLCDESLSTCVERVTICVVRRDE